MPRIALIAAVAFAACSSAWAQDQDTEELDRRWERMQAEEMSQNHDPFVVSGDECGASRYAHLLGEQAGLHAIPANSNMVDGARLSTLEYTPARLNVVVNGQGRIIAIGCF
jgi:hypothetical protein